MSKCVIFDIDYPESKAGKRNWNKNYGLNSIYSGKHWSERKADAEYWHYMVYKALSDYHKNPFDKPVVITFYWNDNLDLSNHAYMAKMIEDAIKGRIIKDDNKKCVLGIEHYWHSEDCIRVKVKTIE